MLKTILKMGVLLIAVACLFRFSLRQSAGMEQIDFNRDIRPILAGKCWSCHGPEAPNQTPRPRLDSEAATLADLGRGRRAIVPGHPEQSQLVRRITTENELIRMPPVSSGRTLTKQEIELLTRWISEGAKWQTHWSFIPPSRPALPSVANRSWPRNPIDYFVLAQLEKAGLQPAPEADRTALIRRVSLDLTGLPPTPGEVDSFLADRSPQAYEKVVDRLLSSPRYGERMAFRWLEAARYADTNGYQIDGDRDMWRWRDWVIEAFNANLPFDQFVIKQLAGDLLPHPTLDEKIATAFNRNHRTNSEDGIVPAEYAVEYVVDRVDTTATVFMGLTLACARCHNHKYDPLTQREYYQTYAYFDSIREDGRVSNFGNAPPWIFAPDREQQKQQRRIQEQIALAEKQFTASVRRWTPAMQRWARSLATKANRQWFPGDDLLVRHALDEGSSLEVVETIEKKSDEPKPAPTAEKVTEKVETGFVNGIPKFVSAPTGTGVEFDGKLFFDAGPAANFDYRDRLHDFKDRFAISAWIYPAAENSGAIVTRMRDNAEGKEDGLPKTKGYGVFFTGGKIHFNLVSVWADDSFLVETENKLPIKKWYHLVATFDSLQPYDKVQIFINGQKQQLKINQGRLFRQFADSGGKLRIGGGGGPEFRFHGALDEVRIYKSLLDAKRISVLACPDPLSRIAAIPAYKQTEAQRVKMLGAYLDDAAPASLRQVWNRLRSLKREEEALVATFPTVMVMDELPEPRPTFLLKRGAYDSPAERVERGVPAVLPAMPAEFPNNRLGFARWLVSREHPLTSRVQVNRFWQMLFGVGLVRTVEDFGVQGEPPSHPELLDWLASEFQSSSENGAWNTRGILRTIVLSATYRQSSRVTPQLAQRDPENRLLARGPRVRLSAEMIRDGALFVSGLLVERPGGPPVRPYQPDGLYKDMAFSNMTGYQQEKGDGLWRRSLYTFWKRTIMPPAMQVFDASAREACTVREPRTNTPLQALNLMNDVTYIEAARMLAERIMIERRDSDPQQRLAWAFRLVTSRPPDARECAVLLGNFTAQLEDFRNHPEKASKLLAMGEKRNSSKLNAEELAAYAVTASLLFNLDEAIVKQ